jgi:hypothetical protein
MNDTEIERLKAENAKLRDKLYCSVSLKYHDSIVDKAMRRLSVANEQIELLNTEYKKVWDVLRTYNPIDIELEYIWFDDEERYIEVED